MLGEKFNQPPKPMMGPRQSGMTVTNPRSIMAIAMKNNMANNAVMQPQMTPLAMAINKRKKKA